MDNRTSFSFASIVAIIAAILSFNVGVFLGLIFAAIAFIFGLLGILSALRPNVRGGGLSTIAVILSFIGVIAAVIKAIMWIF
ncbi:MAG: hypothetical protein V4727_05765 [Verrucomicrobiota bacterium]